MPNLAPGEGRAWKCKHETGPGDVLSDCTKQTETGLLELEDPIYTLIGVPPIIIQ